MSDRLHELSLAAAAAGIARGDCSAAELTEALLERIQRLDATLHSFIEVDREGARAAARAADASAPRSAIHGAPVACKDVFRRTGRAPSAGSALPTLGPGPDATVLRRLAGAGAVLLGELNLDEFAAGGTGDNARFGRCANPWRPAHISGGSSGGSAAAVAARMCYAALGSDAGGSIRIPAALCGVVGLKPTYGRVSRHGALARTWSMDCIGPLARTAEDCALVLETIAGQDPEDATSVAADTGFAPAPGRLALSIGVAADLDAGIDGGVSRALQDAADVLGTQGARLTAVRLGDIERLNALQQVIVKSEGAALLGPLLRAHEDQVSFAARSVLQEGFLIPATRYIEALALRSIELERFVTDVFAQCDLVLLPVVPTTAPRFAALEDAAAIDRFFSDSARLTRFANYLGVPAISVPCGFDHDGLPLAFQLIGPPFAERELLQAAHAYQQVTAHHERTPPGL